MTKGPVVIADYASSLVIFLGIVNLVPRALTTSSPGRFSLAREKRPGDEVEE